MQDMSILHLDMGRWMRTSASFYYVLLFRDIFSSKYLGDFSRFKYFIVKSIPMYLFYFYYNYYV